MAHMATPSASMGFRYKCDISFHAGGGYNFLLGILYSSVNN